jgi:hypothetical protein
MRNTKRDAAKQTTRITGDSWEKSQKSSPDPSLVQLGRPPGEHEVWPAMKNPVGFLLGIELVTSSGPERNRHRPQIHQAPVGDRVYLGSVEVGAWT